MTRPAAVVLAALLTGLQGVFIFFVTLAIGFVFLALSGWEGEHKNGDLAGLVFGSIGLVGALVLAGAIMVWSGSRRWATAVAGFDVLLLALQIWVAVSERVGIETSPATNSVVVGFMMWNLIPLICLLLPASRRWFGRAPGLGRGEPAG